MKLELKLSVIRPPFVEPETLKLRADMKIISNGKHLNHRVETETFPESELDSQQKNFIALNFPNSSDYLADFWADYNEGDEDATLETVTYAK